ncbi:MAG: SH3 domain-containing protein [Verrucomicrobiota bacterium]
MKMTVRLALIAFLAHGLGGQVTGAETNATITTGINAVVEKSAPFNAVAKGANIMVRGLPSLRGDRLGKLKKGDAVTVLETVTHTTTNKHEPAVWYKIALGTNFNVWVHSLYVNTNAMTVKVKTALNLRAGPGEEFNKVGTMKKDAPMIVRRAKEAWLEIEPPVDAFAYVAADFFTVKEGVTPSVAPSVPVVTETPPVPPPVPMPTEVVTLTNQPPVVAMPTNEPMPAPPVAPVVTSPPKPEEVASVPTPPPVAVAPVLPNLAVNVTIEPPPRRIVLREGIVKLSITPNTPSFYVLKSIDTGKTINFLYTTDTNVVLKDMLDRRVLVTGEEAIDKRWPNLPVLAIEKIE